MLTFIFIIALFNSIFLMTLTHGVYFIKLLTKVLCLIFTVSVGLYIANLANFINIDTDKIKHLIFISGILPNIIALFSNISLKSKFLIYTIRIVALIFVITTLIFYMSFFGIIN